MRHAMSVSRLWQVDPVRAKFLVGALPNFLQRPLADHTVIGPTRHLEPSHQLRLSIVDRAAGLTRDRGGERRHVGLELLQPRLQPAQQLLRKAGADQKAGSKWDEVGKRLVTSSARLSCRQTSERRLSD